MQEQRVKKVYHHLEELIKDLSSTGLSHSRFSTIAIHRAKANQLLTRAN